MFVLHPHLESDTVPVAVWPLSRVLLRNDRTYPWLILVPQRDDIQEIHHLSPDDRSRLIHETALASRLLEDVTHADKINVAALGNHVSQLHMHVIARFHDDPAWPDPVWGKLAPVSYDDATLSHTLRLLQENMTPPQMG